MENYKKKHLQSQRKKSLLEYDSKGNEMFENIYKNKKFKRCHGEEVINKNIGTYFWIKDEYSLRLVKNLDDEPKKNYFENIGIKIPDFEDKESKRVIEKYKYYYNLAFQIVTNKITKNTK